jgi:tRNA A-37 threonylcarbamoyl transferase component Bud32
MSERRRSPVPFVLFALALGASGLGIWVKSAATPAGPVLDEAGKLARAHAQQAIEGFVRGLEPHAIAAAGVEKILNAVDDHVNEQTFQDLLDDEEWWERYRRAFAISAVVVGPTVMARRGPATYALAGSPLVEAARQREVASGLVADGDAVYAMGAALITQAKDVRRDHPVLVLGKAVGEKFLQEVAARAGDGVGFSNGNRLVAWAGPSELRPAVAALLGQERKHEGTVPASLAGGEHPRLATALLVAPGLWLWLTVAGPAPAGFPAAAIGLFVLALGLAAAGAVMLARTARAGGPTATYPALSSTSPGVSPPTPGRLDATRAAQDVPRTGERRDRQQPAPSPGSATSATEAPRRRPQSREEIREGGVVGPLSTVGAPALARHTPPYEMGRYHLLKLIGEGGMAEVYIATAHGAEGFERHFVVKRLHPHLTGRKEIVSQFIDEARLQARLLHSNIVSVFDFGRAGEEYFLALEYVNGRDLERVLQRHVQAAGRPLPMSVVFYVAHEVLEALNYAHTRGTSTGQPLGIVHRDVSASNVLVSFQGEVKLSDFGIVKADNRVSHTDVGVVKGNVSYMSPEQARGDNVDHRSDLFSLGMLMFYGLTGRSFYASDAPVNQLMRAAVGPVTEQFAQLDSLPPVAQQILHRALARDPANRYQSAVEFSRDLVGFTSGARSELGDLMKDLYPEEVKRDF